LYTGTGSSQTISGLEFSPDLVWIKPRSATGSHQLFDKVRGDDKAIYSNLANAEEDLSGTVSLLSDGFTVGTSNNLGVSSRTYVAWTWDAGTTTTTNTQGSISSQVRANPSAGFSVVTWTTSGSTGDYISVGHGLNALPGLVITKSRSNVDGWYTAHGFDLTQFGTLNTTNAFASAGAAWGDGITSSVIGMRVGNFTANGYTHVAYCFAPVAGYSSGFSYTGNGSADGSFVYLGFRPRLILLKCSSTTGNWTLVDTARLGYNVDNNPLFPNLSNAEGTADLLDITSNGFKLRTTDASVNSSGATYIGFAWAESPFNYSRAR
jgi:hypothetical protein